MTSAAMVKRRREERPVTVRVLNVTSSAATSTLRLVYAVRIAGRPVVASAAAADMKLLSDKEVTVELGFPVLTKAERKYHYIINIIIVVLYITYSLLDLPLNISRYSSCISVHYI